MARGFILQRLANLLANSADISQIEIAVGLAGCAHAHERKLGRINRLAGIVGGPQTSGFHRGGNNLADFGFDDGRLPAVDEVGFGENRVDSNHFVSIIGQASRRNRAHVPQTEDANYQKRSLSRLIWCAANCPAGSWAENYDHGLRLRRSELFYNVEVALDHLHDVSVFFSSIP